MKLIKLTLDKFAIVDDTIFDYLNQFKWYAMKIRNTFYAARKYIKNGKQAHMYMHHCIIGFPLYGDVVDHKDGNGLNNQQNNLRRISKGKNQQNQIAHRNGRLMGTTFDKNNKRAKPWKAQIRTNGQTKNLGYFKTEQEAHEVCLKELKLKGLD